MDARRPAADALLPVAGVGARLAVMRPARFAAGLCALVLAAESPWAQSAPLCTLLAEADTGRLLHRQGGHCEQRFTPASTFKVPLSLMGFDSGFLVDEHQPAIPFNDSYQATDPSWKTTVDPTSWIKNSVVWYSQQLTTWLGRERLQRYVTKFGYGNQDLAGNPGMNDGVTQAWLSSSLRISPLEQAGFLERVAMRRLPVSAHAYEMTQRLLSLGTLPDGWSVCGKTGTGYLMNADGTPDLTRQVGWFVGWAAKGRRTIVFVQAVSDAGPKTGPRARDDFMKRLPALLDSLPAGAAGQLPPAAPES